MGDQELKIHQEDGRFVFGSNLNACKTASDDASD